MVNAIEAIREREQAKEEEIEMDPVMAQFLKNKKKHFMGVKKNTLALLKKSRKWGKNKKKKRQNIIADNKLMEAPGFYNPPFNIRSPGVKKMGGKNSKGDKKNNTMDEENTS